MVTSEQELRAIEEVVADAERFQSDPEAFCQLLTREVTLINVVGVRLNGRDTVQRAMQEAMETSLANVHTENEIERVTFLRPDVAVMTGNKQVFVERDGAREPESQTRLTFVLVKEEGAWLIAFVQNTPSDI
jgi:uncharacterized protein (TIGR02246 family)